MTEIADVTRTRGRTTGTTETSRSAPAAEGFDEALTDALRGSSTAPVGGAPVGTGRTGAERRAPEPSAAADGVAGPAGGDAPEGGGPTATEGTGGLPTSGTELTSTRSAGAAFARLAERGPWHQALAGVLDAAAGSIEATGTDGTRIAASTNEVASSDPAATTDDAGAAVGTLDGTGGITGGVAAVGVSPAVVASPTAAGSEVDPVEGGVTVPATGTAEAVSTAAGASDATPVATSTGAAGRATSVEAAATTVGDASGQQAVSSVATGRLASAAEPALGDSPGGVGLRPGAPGAVGAGSVTTGVTDSERAPSSGPVGISASGSDATDLTRASGSATRSIDGAAAVPVPAAATASAPETPPGDRLGASFGVPASAPPGRTAAGPDDGTTGTPATPGPLASATVPSSTVPSSTAVSGSAVSGSAPSGAAVSDTAVTGTEAGAEAAGRRPGTAVTPPGDADASGAGFARPDASIGAETRGMPGGGTARTADAPPATTSAPVAPTGARLPTAGVTETPDVTTREDVPVVVTPTPRPAPRPQAGPMADGAETTVRRHDEPGGRVEPLSAVPPAPRAEAVTTGSGLDADTRRDSGGSGQNAPSPTGSSRLDGTGFVQAERGFTAPASAPTPTAASPAPHTPPMADQLMRGITPMLRGTDGSHHVTLHLNPAHLGRVDVTLELRGGEVAVVMRALDSQARELLRNGADDLRAQLAGMGLQASSIDVDAGSSDRGRPTWADAAEAQERAARAAVRDGSGFTLDAEPDVALEPRVPTDQLTYAPATRGTATAAPTDA